MGRIGILFFFLAIAIGYDAVVYDGAYTKSAWEHVRVAASDLSARFDREFVNRDPAPLPPAERTSATQ